MLSYPNPHSLIFLFSFISLYSVTILKMGPFKDHALNFEIVISFLPKLRSTFLGWLLLEIDTEAHRSTTDFFP